jgi:hypothetical protein
MVLLKPTFHLFIFSVAQAYISPVYYLVLLKPTFHLFIYSVAQAYIPPVYF